MRRVVLRRAPARPPPRGPVPASLDRAPFVAPAEGTSLRDSLDAWFERHGVRPRIVGEIEDSALLKTFGEAGAGVFAAPSVVEGEVVRHHRVRVMGRTTDIRERYYAISAERRLKHPAVVAMTQAARSTMADATPALLVERAGIRLAHRPHDARPTAP